MRRLTLRIEDEEYIVVPRAEYARLTKQSDVPDDVRARRVALGRKLRAARGKAGLTQADLARRLRKTQATVSRIERGMIAISAAFAAKVLKACRARSTPRTRTARAA